ncbi:flagellar hook-length control protein FliK [[Pseudomonas] carboxydohydrogena]|uniref:flagellar hook-length control protein FliK n=1 Tax=Afipia carboxydohydrogena TaxID=290 RepID=UPI003B831331
MLNVAHDPAVNSQVYSHRSPPRQDQGVSADDFGSLVDSNAAAANRDVPLPSVQDGTARRADNSNDRPARRDDRDDAKPAEDAQQAAPRTGVVDQKTKKAPANAGAVKTGLSEGKSKTKTKDDAADGTPADLTQSPQTAGDAASPGAVVVAAPAAVTQTETVKSDGKSDATTETATPAPGVSATVAANATSGKDAGAEAEATGTVAKPMVDPSAGHPSFDKSKTGQTQASADGASLAKTGDGANATALSTGIVVLQQATAAPAVTTGVAKTEAVAGIANGKPAKAAVKTDATDQADTKPGADTKPSGDKPAASSANDTNADQGKSDAASAKADKGGAVPAAPSHDRHSSDAPIAKPDVSFQAALDMQAPATQQTQTQQQFTVTAAGPTASAQAASVPVPVNGLAVDIATRAAAGNTSFQIRLDPAELGRIDVRLDVDKHGRVTSHLTVDQPATLDMLRRDAPQLQRALEDAGLKTGDGGLQFSLRDQSPQGGQGDSGQGRQSHRLIVSEEVSTTPQVAGASYGRSSGSSSGIDISI